MPAVRADEATTQAHAEVSQMVRAGRLGDALTRADQFLAGKPRDPQMRFLRGVILSMSGKTNEAIANFTRMTEDYPELPEPYNNLAVLYAGQNQYDKARTALEMAIRTNPSYATAHENLGDVYARLASQAYSKALQLDTSNASVQPKLALIRELFSSPRPAQAPQGSTTSTSSPAPALPATAPSAAARPPATPTAPPAPAPVPTSPPAAVAKAPTPPAPATAATTAPAPAAEVAKPADADVEAAVRAWATAWSGKDMAGYLAAYGKDFETPNKQSRKAWEEERRSRILSKSRISVQLSELKVQSDGSKATVKFHQAYTADALNVNVRKTLDMRKVGERWVIVRETSGS